MFVYIRPHYNSIICCLIAISEFTTHFSEIPDDSGLLPDGGVRPLDDSDGSGVELAEARDGVGLDRSDGEAHGGVQLCRLVGLNCGFDGAGLCWAVS